MTPLYGTLRRLWKAASSQKAGVRTASRVVNSSERPSCAPARGPAAVSRASVGSPSGSNPMLSGERRTRKPRGSMRSTATPDRSAAARQPSLRTARATRGKITTPPMDWPVWTIDMARPRFLRNQWFTAASVA